MSPRNPPIVNGVEVHSHVGEWCPLCLSTGPRPGSAIEVARLRGAFIRAGLHWSLPPSLFDECVAVVAREYDKGPT